MFFIIIDMQITMTCRPILMKTYYIKTGVNVKNGIVKLASVSRRAPFEYPVEESTALCVI